MGRAAVQVDNYVPPKLPEDDEYEVEVNKATLEQSKNDPDRSYFKFALKILGHADENYDTIWTNVMVPIEGEEYYQLFLGNFIKMIECFGIKPNAEGEYASEDMEGKTGFITTKTIEGTDEYPNDKVDVKAFLPKNKGKK